MLLTEYRKLNGQNITLPEGFKLAIKETSNGVYQIDLFDSQMRSVSNHGFEYELDDMVQRAIEDLINMK